MAESRPKIHLAACPLEEAGPEAAGNRLVGYLKKGEQSGKMRQKYAGFPLFIMELAEFFLHFIASDDNIICKRQAGAAERPTSLWVQIV